MHISSNTSEFILGIDVGTSGIRAVVVEKKGLSSSTIQFSTTVDMPFPNRKGSQSEQDPTIWLMTLEKLFSQLQAFDNLSRVTKLVLDATSSTVLLCNLNGEAYSPALMYDDKRALQQADIIKQVGPENSGAHGASSTLSKVLWLETYLPDTLTQFNRRSYCICHQIDFLNHFLTGTINVTDENNALKLGYDSVHQNWPNWVKKLVSSPLPRVVAPGTELAKIRPGLAEKYNFNPNLTVYTGTTDSIAAFLASGANQIGDAVTSLGSTLAIKLLSDRPVFAPRYGIYSHHLKGQWLIGGASNAGGAVLLSHFSLDTLIKLLPQINIDTPTDLHYYPLLSSGERFPIADAELKPKLTPRPNSDTKFLQAMIEGLVEVEALGFQRLSELGAPEVKRIFTAGGGLKNTVWMAIRRQYLTAEIEPAKNTEAAFGVTQLLS
ncbi:FGGY-family carbohydrate kinase [Hydrogenovibrio sp. 3SP14C1]|uniref:FGGY-family carbohydrate kinase n=1 Tax=Hydrogenovibrio sp. 3SP14C1 TaxID=3038774 RepID=UPI002415A218|nr:FGGY-family carbohydrate kinase [Hydrogenovibrio sp. 3SP14C1]MDG4812802.1 FGGY-family carbohydrate kinase [Hydrogenovibrio sp. 3SP14C1]